MSSKAYWRKAMTASCLIHCLVFAAAGWLGGNIFSKAAEPEYIEMELINSTAIAEPAPVPLSMPQTAPPSLVVSREIRTAAAQHPAVSSAVPASTAGEVAESYSPTAAAAASGGYGDDAVPAIASAGGPAGGGNSAPAAPRQKTGPRVLSSVDPNYPEDARQDGVTGTVYISIEVLENGRPGAVEVVSSSGRSSLDEAAVRAVRKWRFVPAQDEYGRNMRCFTRLPVRFWLD